MREHVLTAADCAVARPQARAREASGLGVQRTIQTLDPSSSLGVRQQILYIVNEMELEPMARRRPQ